jgi:NAD(P)H-dependent flavin oxidoreductase YrpB (nitropropane dioxygenase family)
MIGPLGSLELTNPVLAAPMAGGPSTPSMVIAAARAGSLGFLAGGYKTADQLAEQIKEVRSSTTTFGVNLFAPNPVPVDPDAYRRYATSIQVEADGYGLDLADSSPIEDDDHWQAKVGLLLTDPVPVVSFTFGIPPPAVIEAMHRSGALVIQTVTSRQEAQLAVEAHVDMLAVQGHEAGGHYGTLTPRDLPDQVPLAALVRQVRQAVGLPIVAAGGLASAVDVAHVLQEGADAVMVGTILLRTHESGASSPYKSALVQRSGLQTIVTRAFTGRPARALPNVFSDRYDAIAPFGYPAIHHLTSPLRKAAAAADDPERLNLWAGVGYQFACEESTTETLSRLAEHL